MNRNEMKLHYTASSFANQFNTTQNNTIQSPSLTLIPIHTKRTHSVDIRDRDFKAAKRWSDEMVFANRAYFLFEKQPGELAVQNAKESDSGIYRCRVDFKVAQTRNSKVNLTVIRKYIRTLLHYIRILDSKCSKSMLGWSLPLQFLIKNFARLMMLMLAHND